MYAKEGYVGNVDKLSFIMRSLGMAPTIEELKRYYNGHKKEGLFLLLLFKSFNYYFWIKDGQIDFAEFLNILHEHLKVQNTNIEILNAFKAYDNRKTGIIESKELRSILTTTGEKLTNKDVDVILREAGSFKDGKINYQQIVKVLSTPIADY